MIIDILNTDDKRIKSFDYILDACNNMKSVITTFTENDDEECKYLRTSAEILSNMELLQIYSSSPNQVTVKLTVKGKAFVESGTFYDRKERELRKVKDANEAKEHARFQHELNKKTLNAAKREPIYKTLTIILGIITVILAYLQFIK